MKRLLHICGLVLLSTASSIVCAQGNTTPVSLVVHLDAGKRKPPPLSNSDLVLFDNNTKITSAEVEPALGRDAVFAILVDASGSNQDKVDFIKKSAVEIFDAATSFGGSKGSLFTFAEKLEGGKALVNRDEVQQAMSSFRPKQGAPSPLFAAIVEVARSLGANNTPRRLLFVVTDGDDTSAGVSSQDAVEACLKSGVTIIPIGLLSYGSEKAGRANLVNLADATGGRAVILDGPADVKRRVADVLQSEYVVTFSPPTFGGFHNVRMEMTAARKGVSLKTPKGYYIPHY